MVSDASFDRDAAVTYLTGALQRDRFVLYCQPIVHVSSPHSEQRFFEVLVRFRDEEEGLLPPGSFIPVLQEAGLMPLLDRWVITKTIAKLKSMGPDRLTGSDPHFSINLSSDTLSDPDFTEFVSRQLAGARVEAERLMLEIPVHTAAEQPEAFEALVSKLTELGCAVAVSGVSQTDVPMGRLRELGVRYVKFNGASTLRANPNEESVARLGELGETCRNLGIKVIVESVEWDGALDFLDSMRIEFAQGFAIAAPRPL
jgi:EAL domain-containing protein (putative c-di-GMP-specific phosphodiesterase class I)